MDPRDKRTRIRRSGDTCENGNVSSCGERNRSLDRAPTIDRFLSILGAVEVCQQGCDNACSVRRHIVVACAAYIPRMSVVETARVFGCAEAKP